jgi:hypothetical protein
MEIDTILLVAGTWSGLALLSLSLARVAGRADQRSARQMAALPVPVSELPPRRRRITGGLPAGPSTRRRSRSQELRV